MAGSERRKRNLYFVQAAFTLGGSQLRAGRAKTNLGAGLSIRYARRLRFSGIDPSTGKYKKHYFKSSTAKGAAIKAGKKIITQKAKRGSLKGVGVILVTVTLARRKAGQVLLGGRPRTYKVFRRRIGPSSYKLTREGNRWRPPTHGEEKKRMFLRWHSEKIANGEARPDDAPWIPKWKWFAVPVDSAPKSDAITSMYRKIGAGSLKASSTLSALFGHKVVVPKKKRSGGRTKRTGIWKMLF